MPPPTRADLALTLLEALKGNGKLRVDDFQHSLQTATRAERAGATPEVVVAALLHDAGKSVTRRSHGRIAAEILAGSVPREVIWTVQVHEDFTARHLNNGRSPYARYRHRLNDDYRFARRFVDEWDLPSRDPDYDTLPLEHFAPMVHEVLGRTQWYSPRLHRRITRRLGRLLPAPRSSSA